MSLNQTHTENNTIWEPPLRLLLPLTCRALLMSFLQALPSSPRAKKTHPFSRQIATCGDNQRKWHELANKVHNNCQQLSNDGFMLCIHVETNPALHNRKKLLWLISEICYVETRVLHGWAILSQDLRIFYRVEIAENFIRRESHWSIRNSRHVYILAEKQIFVLVSKE